MLSTIERAGKLSPLEQILVLAGDIDRLRIQLDELREGRSIDDSLDVIEVDELSERYKISSEFMRKQLKDRGGKVFKLGKKFVIRKVQLLRVMERMEEGS